MVYHVTESAALIGRLSYFEDEGAPRFLYSRPVRSADVYRVKFRISRSLGVDIPRLECPESICICAKLVREKMASGTLIL